MLPRFVLRGCSRCGGDLFLEEDLEAGKSLSCLQCSHSLTAGEVRALIQAQRVPAAAA
ncbi:MAG: hypothetical protein HY329_21710 [Chloroflexi bacterium]|nr:hypothetical protein [Chloroflexota bacterium]